ncbi:YybS family protein [Bacillus thermotolerans]|uniref:DUF2232 domain-containing protein n=1 Tax=Bacillus thermotolerans TaxID=1221996 RepID=A0A0F5I1U5_BACTR|nr:YybS family protein [Bacillus thermotolerans]KKB39501.1 hypothetical protein QY95_02349 [Bacillus thermotolerans]
MENKNKIIEGVKMGGLFVILLALTLYVPVLGMIVSLLLPLPFLVYGAKQPVQIAIGFALIGILLSILIGGLPAVLLAFLFIVLGTVMGVMIQKKRDKLSIFMTGTLIFLLSMVASYALAMTFAEEAIRGMSDSFQQSYQESIDMMESMGQPVPEEAISQGHAMLDYLSALLPSFLVLFSLVYVLFIMLINFPLAKRMSIDIPRFRPFREWQLPKSILWYYVLFLVLSLMAPPEQGSMWYFAYVNIMFMLQFCLLLQGLSFLYFFFYMKKWSIVFPILLTIFSFLILPLLYLVRLLGIIDLGFDLKRRLQQKG